MISNHGSSCGAWGGAALLLALVGVFYGVELAFGPHRTLLALETAALERGQLYRLITAHLVHLSAHHTMMNALGLALAGCALLPVLGAGWLAAAIGGGMAAISLGWWILQPPGITYVGFSGVLHGIFAFGALQLMRRGLGWMGGLVLACLAIKLGYEALYGPVPGAVQGLGGRISTLSHAMGALGGAVVAPNVRWMKPGLVALALVALAAGVAAEKASRAQAPPVLTDWQV